MHRIDTPNRAVALYGAGKDGWRDGLMASGILPTEFNASFMNSIQEEVAGVIEGAGLILNPASSNQLLIAIENLIEVRAGNYVLDTGLANAYVVALSPAPAARANGQLVRFRVAHANTGASTINDGFGVVGLLNDVGSALAGGDAPLGAVVTAIFDQAAGAYLIVTQVPSQVLSQAQADARYVQLAQVDAWLFSKPSALAPAFTKTGASTISVNAGVSVRVSGSTLYWAAATAIVMPSMTAGTDYAIYACTDGSIRADASFTAPTSYTTGNSRMIGGFHYGLVAPGTTVAGGSFATTGTGKIWVQGDVDAIAGINTYSIWDMKFRPAASNPAGMVLVNGLTWVDIYLCSTDTAANGTSKYNTNIASGTVLPKIPAAFGGNGITTYPTLNWWVANELARANQKRLMRESEFVDAAFGVTESQSIDATASTYPATLRNFGYTSKYGIEQASGHHWTWGEDSNFFSEVASPAGGWKDINGNNGAGTGRGQDDLFGTYGLSRVILGGARSVGAYSGSRASFWSSYPWYSNWSLGLRAACDHLQSA